MAAVNHRKKIAPFLLAFLVSVLAGALGWIDAFSSVDRPLYDVLLKNSPLRVPEDITIIAIDEASVNELGRWPWSRSVHARLLDHIRTADAVFFDVLFSEEQLELAGSVDRSAGEKNADEFFADKMVISGNIVLPVLFDQVHAGGQFVEVLPLPGIANAAVAMGHVHVDFDSDGISRGVYLKEGVGKPFWPHVMLALAAATGEVPEILPGERGGIDTDFSPFFVYRDYYNLLKFFGPPGSVATVSYVDVLEGKISAEYWQGKRVFIGATAQGVGDYIPSPAGSLAGVEYNANIYQAIRQEAFIVKAPQITQLAVNVFSVFLLTVILSRLAPTKFLLTAVCFMFLCLGVATVLFIRSSYWISPVPVIFSIMLFYPLWSWRRIEIALSYLREELFELKTHSEFSSFSLVDLRSQLDYLVEIGIFESWDLSDSESIKVDLWPDYFLLNKRGIVNFINGESCYHLEFESTAKESVVGGVLQALFANLGDGMEALNDSYELVEKTIREIYQIKGDAEKSQMRLNNSLAQLQDAVLITDLAGKILFANDKISVLFGESLTGSSILVLASHFSGYEWLALVKSILVGRAPAYHELDTPSGKKILCQAAVIDGQPDVIVFVFTDVTQLRLLEQSKNEALAFLSHDMRSPIVSLLSLIETYTQSQGIKHEPGAGAGENPGLEPIEGQLQHAKSLIEKIEYFARRNLKYSEDFLQLARAENIDREVFQLVDMHGVVDGAYAETHSLAQARGVNVEISRPDDDCWVHGDAQLLERAVVNLLTNAISHTGEGSSVIMELSASSRVELAVIDQGPGIAEEVIPHLFEPYFRARHRFQGVTDRERKGFGLGLSFVDTVVKRHGGEIQVDSRLGFGTTFRLILQAGAID